MNKKLGLLFFLTRSKINTNGLVTIYLRITIVGIRSDVYSSKQFIDPAKWNNQSQKVNGTNNEVRNINLSLESVRD